MVKIDGEFHLNHPFPPVCENGYSTSSVIEKIKCIHW